MKGDAKENKIRKRWRLWFAGLPWDHSINGKERSLLQGGKWVELERFDCPRLSLRLLDYWGVILTPGPVLIGRARPLGAVWNTPNTPIIPLYKWLVSKTQRQ